MAEYVLEVKQNLPAQKTMGLDTTAFDIGPGKTLKIETTPDGTELLNETVPAGKVWKLTLQVRVAEVNEADA